VLLGVSTVAVGFADDLTRIAGPIDTPIEAPAGAPGATTGADWTWWATDSTVGGLLATPSALDDAVVATLTLEVAAAPGTYHVSLVDAFVVDTSIQPVPIAADTALTIAVTAD